MKWILGSLTLALLLLSARAFCTSKPARLVLLIIPGLTFIAVALGLAAAMYPGTFPFLIPYTTLGTYGTTNTEGTPWEVEVSYKALSHMIPPGVLPQIRLDARSSQGRATMTYDSNWRYGVTEARPVPKFPEGDAQQRKFLRSQVIQALNSVFPFPEGQKPEEYWHQWVGDVTELKPRWDAASASFRATAP